MVTKNCKSCNKEFRVSNYRKSKAMFCSISCAGKSHAPWNKGTGTAILHTCKVCDSRFTRPNNPHRAYKYCSTKCMGLDNEKTQNHSAKMMGRTAWNKNMKGMKPWMDISGLNSFDGEPWNKGTKGVMKAWNKGIPNVHFMGEKNPNWKGGVTEENDKKRRTMEYREWRRQVLKRDGYACQECGATKGHLHAHHIKPFTAHPELQLDINNGQTLCAECHKKTPTYGGKALRYAVAILFIILFSFNAQSQTRFYWETSSPQDVVSTPFGWSTAVGAVVGRILTADTKLSTSIASTTISVNNSSGTATTLFYQGISAALTAQTISGTVSAQFRMSIANTSGATCQSRIKITVVDRSGAIVATLLNITSGAVNLTTTLSGKVAVNAAALSSYACADGDRIVVEIGIGRSAGTTARNGTISFGSSSATDLTASGETTANNPWVEFSGNISFNKGINSSF